MRVTLNIYTSKCLLALDIRTSVSFTFSDVFSLTIEGYTEPLDEGDDLTLTCKLRRMQCLMILSLSLSCRKERVL